jgi:beta-hydroxylase
MVVTITMFILFVFAVMTMSYAYAYRGQARFEGFNEYLRKGWPIFTPFNCMLYMLTQRRAKASIIDLKKFPELNVLQENWEVMRDEIVELHKGNYLELTNDDTSKAYYDIGFRTFYKYGWRKFYLKWYGYTHESAKRLCPKTVEVLSRVPSINGAMISVLPPGAELTRHLDPVACSLRYHLGLSTPNSQDCFINIDGQNYSWRDGEALLFDETYLHYAKNNSDQTRLILMCDIDRPMTLPGRVINAIFKFFMRFSVVPNMEGDKQGAVNRIFSTISPILKKTKALKQTNKTLYLLIKHSVNFTLLLVVVALIATVIRLFEWLAT